MVHFPGLKLLFIQVSFLYGTTLGMGEELCYCINDECLALANTFWRNYNGPLLLPSEADVQYLLCANPEAGAQSPFGTQALTVGRAGHDVAGAVDGPLARAVSAVVPGSRVVAVTICKLNSSAACTGTLAPRSPRPPVTVA